MNTREKALLASSPGLAVLLAGLSWWAVDRWRLHAVDRGVCFFDGLRNAARM